MEGVANLSVLLRLSREAKVSAARTAHAQMTHKTLFLRGASMPAIDMNAYLPALLLVLGVLGNFLLVTTLCTSLYLRDNLVSRLFCQVTYINTLEICFVGWRMMLMGKYNWELMNANKMACTYGYAILVASKLAAAALITVMTLYRIVHMVNPRALVGQRTDLINATMTVIIISLLTGLVVSSVNKQYCSGIKHLHLEAREGTKDEPCDDEHFGLPDGHNKDPDDALYFAQEGIFRNCRMNNYPIKDGFFVLIRYPYCAALVVGFVLFPLSFVVHKLKDRHSCWYRRYHRLTQPVLCRIIIHALTRGLPAEFLNYFYKGQLSIQGYAAWGLVEMFAAGSSFYLLLLISPIFRSEFSQSALVFLGVKKLDVATLILDNEECSSYDYIHPRYNPESSVSNASTLEAELQEWHPGNMHKRKEGDTKPMKDIGGRKRHLTEKEIKAPLSSMVKGLNKNKDWSSKSLTKLN